MKPAPKATTCSMKASSRAARWVTASPPTTLPRAAIRAKVIALDTGEEVRLGVPGRVLEYLGEQSLERFAHLGACPNACGEQVVARDRQGLDGERLVGGAD